MFPKSFGKDDELADVLVDELKNLIYLYVKFHQIHKTMFLVQKKVA